MPMNGTEPAMLEGSTKLPKLRRPIDAAGSVKERTEPAGPNIWSEHDIEVKTSLVDRPLRNLKHGDAFAVLDSYGDFGIVGDTAEGLFYRDTRFLSHFEMRLEGERPLLLSSTMQQNQAALSVDLSNPDSFQENTGKLPRDTVFLHRTKFLWEGACYERVSLRNYGQITRSLAISFLFDADFRDLFEVRGTSRLRRGPPPTATATDSGVEFRYCGLDQVERRTILQFSPVPKQIRSREGRVSGRSFAGCVSFPFYYRRV
jgi:glycogen debranching enzyme